MKNTTKATRHGNMTNKHIANLLASATLNGWTLTRFATWIGLSVEDVLASSKAVHS